jgi:hypothetical protein
VALFLCLPHACVVETQDQPFWWTISPRNGKKAEAIGNLADHMCQRMQSQITQFKQSCTFERSHAKQDVHGYQCLHFYFLRNWSKFGAFT